MARRVTHVAGGADVRGVPPPVPHGIPPGEATAREDRAGKRRAPLHRFREPPDEIPVLELAVVEKDVGVGVGGDGEGALANPLADEGPSLALAVPEADAAVAKVVRRPDWRPGGLARAGDRGSEALLGEAGEDGPGGVAVLARGERRDDGPVEVGWEGDPAPAAALLQRPADTPARVGLVEVAAAKALLLELADAHAGGVEDEEGERIARGHERQDGLDLLCGGRRRLLALLARKAHVHAVAGGIVLDAREVEHLREHADALSDRLALAPGGVEGGDERGDIGRRDLVDPAGAEQRQEAPELDAVPDGGRLGDVDARGAPALGGLGECWEGAGTLLEGSDSRHAHRGELAGDPAPARQGLAPGREGAGVAVGALAPAEAVLDQVAASALPGLPPLDPGARHARTARGRRGRCAPRRARGSARRGSAAASSRAKRRPAAGGRRRRSRAARARARAGASG